MRTTVEIPDPLFREAKRVVAGRGETLKSLIIRSLTSELQALRSAGEKVRNPLPEVAVSADAPILRLSPSDLKAIDADAEAEKILALPD